ncbi:ATP-dependent 6-phosphofructokinase [Sporomusa sp.]|uniref:6-phosphofructokinase n=1 Tax=Sporomusa sp. TaxID=2078658 RepID=UPI002CA9898C|nr:ATP-dependent 6-phosphofructokinase [Sporomusa sp.]HWR44567.1 ATP-dependent 6-phosphofructokinase [Sporomusa sp.]
MAKLNKVKTIAILTGGGDAPGLNAVIRAVVRTALGQGLTVWGIKNGFGGMVENQMIQLTDNSVAGILPRGGTMLGTTNRDNPFSYPKKQDGKIVYQDMSVQAMDNLRQAGIEALVVIGGDGTLKIAAEFYQMGLPVVGVPKTIDNDIPDTERTFGFDTAVGVATDALDRLHTTAESHHRVMVLEVMGRYAGWIALHAGMAGGADCILIPEIPFKTDSVIAKIKERQQRGRQFSLIVIAEGAHPQGGEISIARIVEGSHEKVRLGGIGEKLAREIEELTGMESRCTVLGHVQRGGTPTAFDRVLSTRYGVAAAQCVLDGAFGNMVALQKNQIIRVPIVDIAGKANNVTSDNELLTAGRAIGICFGD